MLSNIAVLVIVYTIIDLFTSPANQVMSRVYTMMQNQNYDGSSALMWSFLAIVGAIVALVMLIFAIVFRRKNAD